MNQKTIKIVQTTVSALEELHERKLFELGAYVSFGMDTGIRPFDLEYVDRKNIVGNIVRGVKYHHFDIEYGDLVLSERTLSLLHYLPDQGRLFPKKSYQYNSLIRKHTNSKDFSAHYMRTCFLHANLEEYLLNCENEEILAAASE